ncbi:MAG: class I SAM-dependent methyltransferase [bacterium]
MSSAHAVQPLASSFRDPSGFVFMKDGVPYRQVNHAYKEAYDLLMSSGLYAKLIEKGLMVPHVEKPLETKDPLTYKLLKPEPIPFITYPYEWSFSQLQDAALLTLRIQRIALRHGMSLKDASAYNIQFIGHRPVLIDTLSFEIYPEGQPWVAYRQFCQHFLAPLALMAKVDLHMGTLSQLHIDGIPLALASHLLPKRTRLSIGIGAHLHLHARSQNRHADAPSTSREYRLDKTRLLGVLQNLDATVASLKPIRQKTVWDDYYETTHNYSKGSLSEKEKLVSKWIAKITPGTVWDAGANDGTFSRLASATGARTVASDIDPVAVERGYRLSRKQKDENLLSMIIDLTNPSPSIGWANQERPSFLERGRFDLALCLALVHHLAIANNLPLDHIARLFAGQAKHLIIEFVPKQDSNAQRLLSAREDIFPGYEQDQFEKVFLRYFTILEQKTMKDTSRTLYLMKRKTA